MLLSQNSDIGWYINSYYRMKAKLDATKNALNTHLLFKVELIFLLALVMSKLEVQAYRTESNQLLFTSTLVSNDYGNVYVNDKICHNII